MMTAFDQDLLSGWLAAQRGEPCDRHASPAFREGYALALSVRNRHRTQGSIHAH
jgi:hypothetical protein